MNFISNFHGNYIKPLEMESSQFPICNNKTFVGKFFTIDCMLFR